MLQLLCMDYDNRLKAYCVTARCDYRWYLCAVAGAEQNLEIQRAIIKGTRVYATLRADLKRGCLMPPIVLAVKSLELPDRLENQFAGISDEKVEKELLAGLSPQLADVNPGNTYIIDGLQRTNALKQTLEEIPGSERESFLSREMRIEIWLNIPFGALAYRMLLLNAGQKPMSIKHQVEILSMKLREELSTIPGIEIIIGSQRRTRKGQFQLARLSETFQAWLQGQPNLDLRNLVMEQLLTESAIEVLGSSLKGDTPTQEKDAFMSFIEWLVAIDQSLPDSALQFLSNETVLQGLGAAVGFAERNPTLQPRMEQCLKLLLEKTKAEPLSDPFGIVEFDRLRRGIDPAKVNVGQATRDMVFRSFKEYFINNGIETMPKCWEVAAGMG